MTWTVSILLSVVCLTGHILSVKILGEKFPSVFVTPAFYTFAILLLYGMFFFDRPKINWEEVSHLSVLVPLVIAGVTIGLTDFFFVKSLNLGAEASTVMPILVGGSTVLVSVFAFLVFKESVSVAKLSGIALAVLGVFLIHKG